MYFFIHGGGGLPKNYSDEGGAMRNTSEIGGIIQFSNYTPPNPDSNALRKSVKITPTTFP